jgi:uncharacterized protein
MNVPFIKKVIQYVEELENIGKKFYYNMTTNGVLLVRYMDYLAEKEFTLTISLDGNECDHSYRVDDKGRDSHKRLSRVLSFYSKLILNIPQACQFQLGSA